MVKSAKLIDNENDYVIATYEQTEDYEMSADGVIQEAVSWDGDSGEPCEIKFFAGVMVKWDGCSHINFYGEDYIDKDSGDKDSYYHLCGVGSYINFMRLLVFAYEIMVEHVGYEKVLEKEEYEELKQLNLLKGYSITFE